MRDRRLLPLLFVFALSPLRIQAQNHLLLPGCESVPEVRSALDEKLDFGTLDTMKLADRLTRERQVLGGVIAGYPREFKPYKMLINAVQEDAPDEFPALRDRFTEMASDQATDPLALLLAALVLKGKDTPQSIQLLNTAKTLAPNFPWPYEELASVYSNGKRADLEKLRSNLEGFFSLCPASTDAEARFLLAKDPGLQPKVAVALRERLEKETEPKQLEHYSELWGLEFRMHPPTEHNALRVQVASDIKRLETLRPRGDAEWQAFLINGYKQAGAAEETIRVKEDLLVREYPHSSQASEIAQKRWQDSHKEAR